MNETWARTFSPDAPPVGRRFHLELVGGRRQLRCTRWWEWSTTRSTSGCSDRAPWPVAFLPIVQRGGSADSGRYFVRTSVDPSSFTPEVGQALARVDPKLRFALRLLEDHVSEATRRERVMAMLSSLFGLLAALLAAVGLHGVMPTPSSGAAARSASASRSAPAPAPPSRRCYRERHTGQAAADRLPPVLALTRRRARSSVSHTDPALAMAVGALAIIAPISSLMPAQRAARVDPMSTLKDE